MPKAAPRVCSFPGCNNTSEKSRCSKHRKTHNWKSDKDRGTRKQRGYGNDWTRRRNWVMARDSYLCQLCLKRNVLTPAKEVDHIIPKSKGGSDDVSNLQAICIPCHREKTVHER